VLQLIWPWNLEAPVWVRHAVGWPLVLLGSALAAWAVKAAGPVDLAAPERLVVLGPYRRSRNPMYVAWTLVYLGLALVLGSAWPLALLPAVLLLTHLAVLREERRLAERFGLGFGRYRREVRRYL
jgi:protein-S-isoprenylcysteine O-methyltransferase Ste14